MTNLETILERFDKLMEGKVIGTLIDSEKGKVFVDGEYELEIPRVKNFIKKELTSFLQRTGRKIRRGEVSKQRRLVHPM